MVDLQHVGQRLQDVKVEEGVAGDGAVEPRFEEGRPVALQHPGRAAVVVLANASNSGENHLRAQEQEDPLQATGLTHTSC